MCKLKFKEGDKVRIIRRKHLRNLPPKRLINEKLKLKH